MTCFYVIAGALIRTAFCATNSLRRAIYGFFSELVKDESGINIGGAKTGQGHFGLAVAVREGEVHPRERGRRELAEEDAHRGQC